MVSELRIPSLFFCFLPSQESNFFHAPLSNPPPLSSLLSPYQRLLFSGHDWRGSFTSYSSSVFRCPDVHGDVSCCPRVDNSFHAASFSHRLLDPSSTTASASSVIFHRPMAFLPLWWLIVLLFMAWARWSTRGPPLSLNHCRQHLSLLVYPYPGSMLASPHPHRQSPLHHPRVHHCLSQLTRLHGCRLALTYLLFIPVFSP